MFESKCENISFELDERGVATISLNRPEALNALTWDMDQELVRAFSYCSYDEAVRVIVITGEGKHFCAGGDVKTFKKRIDAGEPLPTTGVRYVAEIAKSIRWCDKPVIARINGAAVGAGSAITFAADFRVGDAKTKIGAGFTGMGFSGDTNGLYTLSRIVSPARAQEFYMLAQTLKAEEAYRLGILNCLAEEPKTLDGVTEELVEKLLNSPTKALAYQKRMNNHLNYGDMRLAQEFEECYMVNCQKTADHAEAVNAFLEKRKPEFKGI